MGKKKMKDINSKKEDDLFETFRAMFKKQSDERLYWANEAMKQYLKEEKSESENQRFNKIKTLIDENNGDISKFPAVQELFEYNIFPELNGLNRLIECAKLRGETDLYKIGRRGILEYIIQCVENEPVNGNYFTQDNKQLMVESGKILNKSGGIQDMIWRMIWFGHLFQKDTKVRLIDFGMVLVSGGHDLIIYIQK
jgi:hypothetical protein